MYSDLTSYIKLSPNCNSPRRHPVRKIAVHHMAGNLSVEDCAAMFARPERQASANYVIGSDGRIVLCVDEGDRAWTSGNAENDHQAITIEVANDRPSDAGGWHVSDEAMISLVALCTDICRRYGFSLTFTGDASGSMTFHRMFQPTLCPGPYIESAIVELCDEVNARLSGRVYKMRDAAKLGRALAGWKGYRRWLYDVNGDGKVNARDLAAMLRLIAGHKSATAAVTVKVGDVVRVLPDVRTYAGGTFMPSWVREVDLFVRGIEKAGSVYLLSTEPRGDVYTGRVRSIDVYKI